VEITILCTWKTCLITHTTGVQNLHIFGHVFSKPLSAILVVIMNIRSRQKKHPSFADVAIFKMKPFLFRKEVYLQFGTTKNVPLLYPRDKSELRITEKPPYAVGPSESSLCTPILPFILHLSSGPLTRRKTTFVPK